MRNAMSLCGILVAGGMMVSCMGEKKLETQALAPSESEARAMAAAQLNDQANALGAEKGSSGYVVSGAPHFSTKVVAHGDGATVYEVTGKETLKPAK